MATNYPGSLDSYTAKTDGVDVIMAAHVNNMQDAIVAVETELGSNPKGAFTSVAAAIAAKVSKAGDTMTGNLAMSGFKVTGLGAPAADGDAATKAYVDATAQGLDVKGSVRAATSANITLSGLQTIDGIALSANDRVLVKDQSTASQNGIYLAASGAWTRAADADSSADVSAGMYVFVEEGTVNADSGFVLTTNNPITLGSTSLAFTQFTGTGQITAGNGLIKVGNTLDVGAGDGLSAMSDSIELALDGTTLSKSGAGLKVNAGGINNAEINAAAGIASTKLADWSADRNANGNKLINLAMPAASGDAATKGYVDGHANMPTSGQKSALVGSKGTPSAGNKYVTETDPAVDGARVRFLDDFFTDKDPRWTLSGTGGTYTQNVEVNGTGTLATGATTSNKAQLSFNGKRMTEKVKSPRVNTRAKLSATTEVSAVMAGLYNDDDNLVEILYDVSGSPGNFKYRTKSGGTETLVDSGLAADTSYHRFLINVDNGTSDVKFFIDNVNQQTINTNVPTALMEPRIGVTTKENADKQMTVDFFLLHADR
jgi:hypothetical protein